MPSFGGIDIFGAQVSMQTADNPRAEQANAYPGLSGIESLDQGLRGRYTAVTGRLYGSDASGLGFSEDFFRSYNDGNAYVLVDMFGNVWLSVKLDEFAPQGRVMADPFTGVYFRPYTARFKHLV